MSQLIKNFIHGEQGPLTEILKKAHQLKFLNEKIMQHLRPELMTHCSVASLQNGLLRMAVDSASFAMQLRYDIPGLLEQFRLDEDLPQIDTIDFYVDAEWGNIYRRAHRRVD